MHRDKVTQGFKLVFEKIGLKKWVQLLEDVKKQLNNKEKKQIELQKYK